MLQGVRYVLNENIRNLYRTYSIAKYEVLGDMKESRLGLFWNFANPLIQVATYWFVFGYVMNRNEVNGIDYISWMLAGMCMWFFLRPCISGGCNAIYKKVKIISKMKFPVSILPATVVFKEVFNHACFMVIVFILLILKGHYPSLHWFGILYYLACGILFCISLSLVTSVLNMVARDVKKFVDAIMRLLMYLTPILWSLDALPAQLQRIIMLNPMYYLVAGYRDCFFYHEGFLAYKEQMLIFWIWTLVLFWLGSTLMYHFRRKFIDLI